MCFGCSNEPSQRDGSFKYAQHMFWLSEKISKVTHSYLGACYSTGFEGRVRCPRMLEYLTLLVCCVSFVQPRKIVISL